MLLPNLFRVSAWEVNLVHGSDQFQIMREGEIEVGDCLGLNSLIGVHKKHHSCIANQQTVKNVEKIPTLASSEGAGDLVAEVDMSRSVDHVEEVLLPLVFVQHAG